MPLSALNQEIDRYIKGAKETGQTVSDYYRTTYQGATGVDFEATGRDTPDIGDPGGVTELSPLDPRYLDGGPDDPALEDFLRRAGGAAWKTDPGVRQEAYARQTPSTVWGRMGLLGQLATDPTGAAVSTQQLAPMGRAAIEDVLYRDVMPGYSFAVAEAARRQAANLPPDGEPFELGFEQFARGAPGRERLSAEQLGQGRANVIAALQRAAGATEGDPASFPSLLDMELREYLSKGSTSDYPLSDPTNPRLLSALYGQTLGQISPRYRRGAQADITQRLQNLMAVQPEKSFLELVTGNRQPPPQYLGSPFAGDQPFNR